MTLVCGKASGHLAVFDPKQTSDGLALSCGNHCLAKVGRTLCGSARAMVPLPAGVFVYVEFSVRFIVFVSLSLNSPPLSLLLIIILFSRSFIL